jgi:hypothetical protein
MDKINKETVITEYQNLINDELKNIEENFDNINNFDVMQNVKSSKENNNVKS